MPAHELDGAYMLHPSVLRSPSVLAAQKELH